MQLKYSNYVAFSHDYGFAVNNSGLFMKKMQMHLQSQKKWCMLA